MNSAFSLAIYIVLVLGTAAAIVGLSMLIGRREVREECLIPYECGLDPVDAPRHRFSVKFFLIAVLFIVFDVEIVFLYPWARVYREMIDQGLGLLMFIQMAVFVLILAIGLLYVWRVGALKWEE